MSLFKLLQTFSLPSFYFWNTYILAHRFFFVKNFFPKIELFLKNRLQFPFYNVIIGAVRIMITSDRIKEAMQLRGVKAAELCRRTGISKSLISRYVNNQGDPKLDKLHKIAIALNVQEAWLMGYDLPMDRPVGGEYTEKEKALLDLFKAIPADRQGAVLDLLKAALNIQAK